MKVRKISTIQDDEKLRVCAYIRVSTGHEKQLASLDNQRQYYENKIKNNPGYEYCGIYSDAGVSGAKENRDGLQSMLADARAGKMDLILTKSISRFARNTRMLLQYVRELQQLGVGIVFEEQGINSATANGEVMLTILASLAEEERKNVSENVKWAMRRKFKRGEVLVDTNRFMGFTKDEKGRLIINDDEAKIIKTIFKMYLDGISAYRIAKELNALHCPTDNKREWTSHRILSIISNEKYMGDCLLQKSFISEFTGKQQRNQGELEQFYIRNNHEAIVSRDDWEKAQKIRNSRKGAEYPYRSILHCPYCEATLRRHRKWKDKYDWVCATYLEKGKEACMGIKVPESLLANYEFSEPTVVREVNEGEEKGYCFTKKSEYRRAAKTEKSSSVLQSIDRQRRTVIKL
ncbi:recombinase family protein [Clostridium tyrobutyricum]|uniref:recombinase family protein n=1 Tax=Clostridium tyrobutyricum TaxID=1519 RepID=UPI001C389DB4|nr:recombinase family protein [Clostridium tyrobutyricum]MBV4424279.1 recombinase family protein [Clostridium tyrobutyricum]